MSPFRTGERVLTELDAARLRKLRPGGLPLPPLTHLLDEADVVAPQAIPADVVTMYAQFVIHDERTGQRQTLVLCYPADAEPAQGFISVLSPAGLGLIGLPVGAQARWAGPGGEETVARIEAIQFQPEATGDYLT